MRTIHPNGQYFITEAESGIYYGKDPYFTLTNAKTRMALTMSLNQSFEADEDSAGTTDVLKNFFYIHGQGETVLVPSPTELDHLFFTWMDCQEKLDALYEDEADEDSAEKSDERMYAQVGAGDDIICALNCLDEDECKLLWKTILKAVPKVLTHKADPSVC